VSARLRAVCPSCRHHHALRQDGTLRAHWLTDPESGLRLIGNRCPGVGMRPASPQQVTR
jgi:hypothetical protein